LAGFLAGRRVPTVLGFDPLFQFMHEHDAVKAITTSLEGKLRGVFNVSGPQPLPLSLIIRGTGRTLAPIPEPLFRAAVGRFGLPFLPQGAISHIKYPVVIDSSAFREATGFEHDYDEHETLAEFARAAAREGLAY
jgi:UDP-glucose 4-epimerase